MRRSIVRINTIMWGGWWFRIRGAEARAHALNGQWGTQDGPYSHGYNYDVWGNITSRSGWGGWNPSYSNASFNNKNQMTINPGLGTPMQYDAAGNMINDGWQRFTYDATGAQVQAPDSSKWQGHDGDGLRVKDVEGGNATYYLRSSVLGGQVAAEINASGAWTRGYVYAGQQLVAVQSGGNYFVHQDPITKSQRITNGAGAVVEAIELDPFGGETNRSWGPQYQKHRYTTWERDWTGDESLFRRYHGWWSRFAHPDPYDGSYDLGDPQSFNRYAYVQNDPVNFTDPSGLDPDDPPNRWDPSDVVRVYTLDRRPGGGDNSLLFYRGVSGLGERFSRMLYDPGASGRDLIPQNQEPMGGIHNSLGVPESFRDIRCKHFRELLNREAKYGTGKAARRSMSIRGGDSLYGLNNGPGIVTVDGRQIDQDWLITLKGFAHGRGFRVAAGFYEAGKAANRAGNKLPGGKRVSPAWEEQGERVAVDLAGSSASFASIFDERFMKAVCPGY